MRVILGNDITGVVLLFVVCSLGPWADYTGLLYAIALWMMDICFRLYLDFCCKARVTRSVFRNMCNNWKNREFFIWTGVFLTLIILVYKWFENVSNLLAEIPSKI